MNDLAADTPTTPNQRRHWLAPTRLRVYLSLLIAMALWGWFDVRERGVVDPKQPLRHKTDLTVYTETGPAFYDGRDPYTVVNPRRWGYLYPPLFAMLMAPLRQLDWQDQVYVWFAISVALCWLCFVEYVRIGRVLLGQEQPRRATGPIPPWLAALAIAAAAIPVLNTLQRGQVGVLKLYGLLWGLRLVLENRSQLRTFCGGLVLAFPIVLKITPLAPVGFLAYERMMAALHAPRGQRAGAQAGALWLGIATGLIAFFLLVPAALVGWQKNLTHLDTWWRTVATHGEDISSDEFAGDSTSMRNQSFTNAARRFGNWTHYMVAGGPSDHRNSQLVKTQRPFLMNRAGFEPAFWAVRGFAALILLAVGYRVGKAQDQLGQYAAFGLACIATLIVGTIARGHYFLLYLPAVTGMGLWLLDQGRRRSAIAMCVIPLVLVIAHYAVIKYAGRIGLLGLGTTLWYLAACGMLIVGRRSVAVASIEAGEPHTLRFEPRLLAEPERQRRRAA